MFHDKEVDNLSRLPGPKGLPVLGNLFQIDLPRLHLILEQWADRYGAVYRFNLASKTVVVVSSTELIQHILRDRPDIYRRASVIEQITKELGTHGVFAAEGAQWQRQRSLTAQAFKAENLRRFFPTLHNITERLQKRWFRKTADGRVIDVSSDWMRFTVDVTTLFAFGYDINLLEKENDDFQRHLQRQLPAFNRWANAPFPYWHYFKLPSDRAMEKSLAVIKETIRGFVRQTQQRLEQQSGLIQPANFLEALLLSRDEEGARMSGEEIEGNIITLLLAGEDTTAHTLSWIMHLIAGHPSVQACMQHEADAVLGGEALPPDIGAIEKLTYIEAVAHEAMRLKSVAPMLFLEANADTELNGITIPKGTPLMLLTRYGALQEENFTDARAFKPERWLDTPPAECAHNRNASLPFGAGPRFCPGRNLALLEIKMALAMVCRNFSVSRIDAGKPVQEVFSFTMMPDHLRLGLKERCPANNPDKV